MFEIPRLAKATPVSAREAKSMNNKMADDEISIGRNVWVKSKKISPSK